MLRCGRCSNCVARNIPCIPRVGRKRGPPLREAGDAADNAATKFAAMQHRVAQLSGKIGGMSRAARSATDVAEMEVTDACNAKRATARRRR